MQDKKKILLERYFKYLEEKALKEYEIAKKARSLGLDPVDDVEIMIAKDMAERVENIVSFVVPKLANRGLSKRIRELEEEYGFLDWRVGLKIAEEVALGKFCKFDSIEEAIDAGIRTGLAYITMGVVSAPIEGIIRVKIKKRLDGKPYLAVYYAGPIRTAGGTAGAYSVLLADYLRRKFNLYPYDPTEDEIQRYIVEIDDYHARARLQYKPTAEEIRFIVTHVPVEVTGDGTEDREVSAKKDLPRVETNVIRGGMALIMGESLAAKLKKFPKKMEKWAKEFGLEDWVEFAKEFKKLQEEIHAANKEEKEEEESDMPIKPDAKYLEKSVAGRPILAEPMAKGGFRLRYGRSRNTGLAAIGIHPATMVLTGNFIAIGTQLAIERPGKAGAAMPVDTIEGPIVKLKDGSVIRVETYEKALEVKDEVEEILFLGDMLVAVGEFLQNGHILVPSGYVEEWWAQEVEREMKEKNISLEELAFKIGIEEEFLRKIIEDPLKFKPSGEVAVKISKILGVPIHPRYTYHWHDISAEDIKYLYEKIKNNIKTDKIEIAFDEKIKRILEDACIPHKVLENKIIIDGDDFYVLKEIFSNEVSEISGKDGLDAINKISPIEIRKKVGLYVGARLGRPEKSSIRKLKGRPCILFPVGQEGGRMRNLIEALEKGFVTAEAPMFYCKKCNRWTIYPKCEVCGEETIRYYKCRVCGKRVRTEVHCGVPTSPTELKKIDVKHYLKLALNNLGLPMPKLLKGVRGMSSREKIPERLEKGILRAKYKLYVNKDGTVRFDAIEVPITHFRPREIGVSVEKLRELGYKYDIYGDPLVSEDQIVELFPQDIILPDPDVPDKEERSAASVFMRVAQFIDELLEKFYGLPKYYNVKRKEDLVGNLVLVLAPHTSAGTVARIIGFSKTQTFMAHPYLHAAIRRNCFYPTTGIFILKDNELLFDEIGKIVENMISEGKCTIIREKDTVIAKPKNKMFTIGITEEGKIEIKEIKHFMRRKDDTWVKIKLASGKTLIVTPDHPTIVYENGKFILKNAKDIRRGDLFPIIANLPNIVKCEINDIIDLYKLLKDNIPEIIVEKDYISLPYSRVNRVKRYVKIDEDLMWLFGLYLAEGYIHENETTYQVCFRNFDDGIISKLRRVIKEKFDIDIISDEEGRYIISSKIVMEFFKKMGFGTKNENKDIPSWIFALDNEKISALLAGIIDGDGSIIKKPKKAYIYSANKKVINKIALLLSKLGIFCRWKIDKGRFGKKVLERYKELGKEPKDSVVYRIDITSEDFVIFISKISNYIASVEKRKKIKSINLNSYKKRFCIVNGKRIKITKIIDIFLEPVLEVEVFKEDNYSYSLEVKGDKIEKTVLLEYGIIQHQCDGDEGGMMLLLDALLNFSRKFLPAKRGGTQDAPLVMTLKLDPKAVDDEVHNMDVVQKYPIEFYELTQRWADPGEAVEKGYVEIIKNRLGKDNQYYDLWFTHDTSDINRGSPISAYKELNTMEDKLREETKVARMIRAVDEAFVLLVTIKNHFLKDIKGNFRKFFSQVFRCVNCNEKFRRIPLSGRCPKCGGRIIFTVTEGSIKKYLIHAVKSAEEYKFNPYDYQTIMFLKRRVDLLFGEEKDQGLLKFLNGGKK